jgi:hypothetical protein
MSASTERPWRDNVESIALGNRPVQVPIACTLAGGAARARVDRWRAILASHLIERRLTGDALVMRFRKDADAERELTELAVAERDCCAFVGWGLEPESDVLVLRITGEPDALGSLNFVG